VLETLIEGGKGIVKHINRLPLLAVGLTLCFGGLASAQKIQPSGIQQIQTLLQAKARWTPAQRKLDSHLLMSAQLARGDLSAATMPGIQNVSKHLKFDDLQRVLVDIQGKVNDELLGEIGRLGGRVESSFPKYGAIRAWIPLSNAEALAERADVTSIRPAAKVIHDAQPGNRATTAGKRLSLAERRENVRRQLKEILPSFAANRASTEISGLAPLTAPIDISGLISEGADLVQSAGVTGAGVKVGVLSDGVDSLAALQALGDLPADVTVISGQAGSGDEGTAILEIVHDLAPGAQLFYATADGGLAQMATNIESLAAAGCNIIVDDANYLAEAVFQDDIVAQAINTVTASGVLYFASAHNMGNLDSGTSGTWEGDFNGTGATIPVINTGYGTTVPVHAFDATHNYDAITANTGLVTLKWSDPVGASCNDYDLFTMNSALTSVYDYSVGVQDCSEDPIEGAYSDDGDVVVVVLYSGATRALRVDTWGGGLAIGTSGSTCGHNAAASAVTVAATPAQSTIFTAGNQAPEYYSSDGPRRMFYHPDGSAITAGNFLFGTSGGTTLSKVDLTAADCGESDVSGFNPFCGTSAAAPTAAAIAALVMSANPSLTPSQVLSVMKSTALSAQAGFQSRTVGAGVVMANLAVDAVNRTAVPSPSPLPAFGSQLVGTTSAAQTITLSNTGTGTLTISSITASGDFSASDTCGTTLNGGENCPISVTFHPTAGGSRSGTLTITDDAFDSPQHVALSGTGQDFTMAAASGSSTSASVAAGGTATYTLAVGGLGGFSDSVSFACTGAPSKSNCTVSPNTLTPGSSATNIAVTVTTTAASGSAPRSLPLPPAKPLLPRAGSLLMLALALAGVAWAIRGWHRPEASQRRAAFLTLAAGLLLTLAMAACGGGGGGGGHTPIPGTPAGTYTLTVTGSASSSSVSHTVTLTLTVS
jgi:hypothetical protein